MPKLLSQAAVETYRRDGFYSPVRVMSAADAHNYRNALETHEAHDGRPLQGNMRHKTHLLFTWADELVHHPRILDAVEDAIGPDILCWTTNFFIKEAHSPGFVSWHQDSTYWGLDPDEVITAWVAFTDVTPENGYMQVIPGSHKIDQLPHVDTFHKDNLLSRGQEIAVEVDKSKAVGLDLRAGEMSLHHIKLVHGSEANHTDDRRIGLAIRTSRLMCGRPRCATRPCWCAAPINSTTSTTRQGPVGTSIRARWPRTPIRWRARSRRCIRAPRRPRFAPERRACAAVHLPARDKYPGKR